MSDSANITQHYQLATVYGANFVEHPTGSGSTRRWLDSREIGRGGFGVVKAQNAVHSTAVRAVKIITKRDIPAGLDWKREIVAMATLAKYSQFVEFQGWYENVDYVAIVMELIQHGDLADYLKHQPKPEEEAREISWQIVNGLEVMHRHGFAHRDLKPANIFMSSISPKVTVKIGDFGISKRIVAHPSASTAATFLRTRVYTPDYAAPEVVQHEAGPNGVYTSAVDLWSLGCITHEILTGHTPFPHPFALFKYCAGDRSAMQEINNLGVSQEAIEFVSRMLEPDGQERPKAMDAKWMPWVRGLTTAAEVGEAQKEKRSELEKEVYKELDALTNTHEDLRKKYMAVKRLYFEGKAEIEAFKKSMVTKEEYEEMKRKWNEQEKELAKAKEATARSEMDQEVVRKTIKEMASYAEYQRLYHESLLKIQSLEELNASKADEALKKDFDILREKYQKVKSLYFDKVGEVEKLNTKITELEKKSTPSGLLSEKRANSDALFETVAKANSNFITGTEALLFFNQSGLSSVTLAHIWGLVDRGTKGHLTREEFALAMFYVEQQQQNNNASPSPQSPFPPQYPGPQPQQPFDTLLELQKQYANSFNLSPSTPSNIFSTPASTPLNNTRPTSFTPADLSRGTWPGQPPPPAPARSPKLGDAFKKFQARYAAGEFSAPAGTSLLENAIRNFGAGDPPAQAPKPWGKGNPNGSPWMG